MERNPSFPPPSSSSSPPAKRFDVFLSFRGEDTRNNFTGHLSLALRKMGLVFNIFKDDIALDKGKEIGPELLNAIEDSRYAVVVLSKNYADSRWCLKELAKIVDCMGDSGRIRTIFYHVDPSDVRNHKGSFGKGLQKHEKDPRHSREEVQSWRKALTKVANQSGETVHSLTDEAIFIKEFVSKISSELGASRRAIDGLFGMSSRLEKLDSYVHQSFATSNVCLIGIHGMGGIGKSTLATAYYKQMSHKFEGSSFLQNVREVCEKEPNGLVDLQKQLLSKILKDNFGEIDCVGDGIDIISSRLHSKKVLIVLDDVNEEDQLDGLAGEDYWFGSGSIIIVTTREDSFLKNRKYKIYEAEYLNPSESLELFSWKAFRSTEPPKDYKKLSEQVVEYASNLPLALTVLGSLFGRKHKSLWNGILCRLRKCPEKKIVEILKISFDDLSEIDKCIFLDIACFFNRYDTDSVIEILDSYGFDSKYGISNLVDKSLLRINGVTWMHDLLQEMGKEIVRKKSDNQLARQSRIWNAEDFYQILKNKEGTNEVEAILAYAESKFLYSFEALSSMNKLRLLQIKSHFERRQTFDGLDGCDVPELSNSLQYLDWSGFPYNKLPSSFQPHNLVQLKLRYSKIKQLWSNDIEPLCYLKVIDLTGSRSLTKLEDFAVVPNLETLILSDCRKLLEIHPSIKHLNKLIILDMPYCLSLKKLPEEINGLASLRILNLYYCHKLEKLPDNMEQLQCLRKLEIRSCRIKHLPSSIFLMENLEIQYDDVTMIEFAIRENIKNYRTTGKCFHTDSFTSLTWLDLNDCKLTGPDAFPEYFGKLACLEYLDLSKNPFSVLPSGINGLSSLRCLRLEHCKNLRCLEAELLPSSLQVVYVNYCTSLASFLDPLKACHLQCSSVFCFDCTELVKRQDGKMMALASLTRFLDQDTSKRRDGSQTLQDSSKRRDVDFKFVIPQSDNELPSWFMNQSPTTSISIELDPECHNSELIGFALAFCFRADSAQIVFGCNLRVGDSEDWETEFQVNVKETGMLDHLFLMYSRCDETTLECIKELEPTSSDTLEFSFYNICYKGCTSFGPCGIRMVYEEDIEELKEITSNYNNDQKDVQSSHSKSINQLFELRNMGPIGLPLWTGLRGILDLKDDLEMQQYADEDSPNNPESNPSMVGNTHFGVFRNYTGITTKLLDNLKGGREAE